MIKVGAGPRLDRLPIAPFHWRLLRMVGAGLFLDSVDVYMAAGLLGSLVHSGWSDMAHNARFISATFAGMFFGAWLAGVLGDRLGRRFAYQSNLLIFGIASLAGAAAPTMQWLIGLRFIMGIGLGAEIVTGYVILTEFVPPARRGRWGSGLAAISSTGLFASSLMSLIVIPTIGWRWMFVIVGVGALVIWYVRRAIPESPRWLEAKGRLAEAERVMSSIEKEIADTSVIPELSASTPPPHPKKQDFFSLFSRELMPRTLVGIVLMITMNTALYGFIAWMPTFFVKEGAGVVKSLEFTTLMSLGGPVGTICAIWLSDRMGRRAGIIGFSILASILGGVYPYMAAPAAVTLLGFLLVTNIYVLFAFIWALYLPELFPTDLRMRGVGICNMAGRLMTVITPFMVLTVFSSRGVFGVVSVLGGLLLLQAFVVTCWGIETKLRPLEALAPSDVVLS
jgi:putative MFS transporter